MLILRRCNFHSVLVFFWFLTLGWWSNSQELTNYECIYNHWETDNYMSLYNRKLDSVGIITQTGKYHALTICFYGIINYHEFLDTGDSSYYYNCVNQFNYFKDTSKLNYFDNNNSIGLPYHFNFGDMKSPWYSGMTQGVAASYLLRYYQLTKDPHSLDLAEKIVNFMIKPEEEGGTISKTNEGKMWIEEYPCSTKSKSVLNGFINGLIGLYEFAEFFPERDDVALIVDSCYQSMVSSFKYYDTPNWTYYNRNRKGVSKAYMRYQISELDHLFSLFNDEKLRDQMRLWAVMAYGKIDAEIKYYRHPQYQYALELLSIEDNPSSQIFNREALFLSATNAEGSQLYSKKRKVRKIDFDLDTTVLFTKLSLGYSLSANDTILIYNDKKEVKANVKLLDSMLIVQNEDGFDKIEIQNKKKVKIGKNNLIAQNQYYDYQNYKLPMFMFYQLKQLNRFVQGDIVTFNVEGFNLTNAKVFYRVANSGRDIKSVNYSIENVVPLKDNGFIIPKNGVYEFFIVYDVSHPVSALYHFSVNKSE